MSEGNMCVTLARVQILDGDLLYIVLGNRLIMTVLFQMCELQAVAWSYT